MKLLRCIRHGRRRRTDDGCDPAALQRTERELARVMAQWPRVLRYVAELREYGERNHFSESIAHIYRGDR